MAEGIDAISPVGAFGAMDDRGSGGRHKHGSAANRDASPSAGAEAAATAPSAAAPPSPETLQEAVQQINERLAGLNRALELRVDPGTGLTAAVIRNAQTGELLQQIPAEDGIQLAKMLSAWSHGDSVLLDLIA